LLSLAQQAALKDQEKRGGPDALRTKLWCDGWTWALSMPMLLVGSAAMAVYLDPSGPLTKYAAVFLAEIISLFV